MTLLRPGLETASSDGRPSLKRNLLCFPGGRDVFSGEHTQAADIVVVQQGLFVTPATSRACQSPCCLDGIGLYSTKDARLRCSWRAAEAGTLSQSKSPCKEALRSQ